jgi:hypothetical protein
MKPSKSKYNELLKSIGVTLQEAKENAYKAINVELIKANWLIGKYIVEYEQQGKSKADYGSALLTSLAKDLGAQFGKGFSKSNFYLWRLFYLKYPKFQTVSGKFEIFQTLSGKLGNRQTVSGKLLSWSHYAELLTISDDLARSFYEKQAIIENWSLREMFRRAGKRYN